MTDTLKLQHTLTPQECATVLHGLRLIQCHGCIQGCAAGDCEHFEDCEELTDLQIDELCEAFNFGDFDPPKHELIIRSLRDIDATCSCGQWFLNSPAYDRETDKQLRAQIETQFAIHAGLLALVAEPEESNSWTPQLLTFARHFFEWHATRFEDFDGETNKQLLCLANEAERAINLAEQPKRLDLYMIRHEHEYGVDVWLLRADHLPTEEEAVKAYGLDFEPEKAETLDIDAVHEPIREL